jgi:hypothetical protein
MEPMARRARSLARKSRDAIVALLVAGMLVGPARADPPRFAQRWEDLSPQDRDRAMRNYQRYKKLPEDQRRQLDQSYERWRGMNPGDRDRVRRNYQSYRQLDRKQREDFGQRYKQWQGGGGKGGGGKGGGGNRGDGR